jgi:hypothetical protein
LAHFGPFWLIFGSFLSHFRHISSHFNLWNLKIIDFGPWIGQNGSYVGAGDARNAALLQRKNGIFQGGAGKK